MNRSLPYLRYLGERHSRAFVSGSYVRFSIDTTTSKKISGNTLPTLLSCQQQRCMATNRRKHRMLSKSKAGGSKQHQPRRGKKGSSEQTQTAIRPPKNYLKKLRKNSHEPLSIPPALLAPTASPYAYISQTALGNSDDEEHALDPSTLFAEVTPSSETITAPPLFAKGDFHYFSPKKDLGYEYPINGKPEIAFLGRSNVGKSSLVNALMRKNLCLTSRTPGRTQLPYYYGVIPKAATNTNPNKGGRKQQPERKDPNLAQGFIVDLPGYGYGRAPTNVTEDWQKDTQQLLLNRRHEAGVLQRLFLLMDARRGMEGPNEHDRIVMRWLEDAEIPFTIVLTKADRVSVPLVVKQVNDFCLRYASHQQHNFFVAQSPVVHVTSSTRGWGIHELMLAIETEFYGETEDDDDDDEEEYSEFDIGSFRDGELEGR